MEPVILEESLPWFLEKNSGCLHEGMWAKAVRVQYPGSLGSVCRVRVDKMPNGKFTEDHQSDHAHQMAQQILNLTGSVRRMYKKLEMNQHSKEK